MSTKWTVNINIQPEYQTIWQRLAATIMDNLVLLPFAIPWLVFVSGRVHAPAAWALPAFFIWLAALPAYRLLLLGRSGQTWGMRVMKIKLVDLSGDAVALHQVLLLLLVPMLLAAANFVVSAGDIWSGVKLSEAGGGSVFGYGGLVFSVASVVVLLVNNKRRRIEDFIAGSVVIRLKPPVVDVRPEAVGQAKVRQALIWGGGFFISLAAAHVLLFVALALGGNSESIGVLVSRPIILAVEGLIMLRLGRSRQRTAAPLSNSKRRALNFGGVMLGLVALLYIFFFLIDLLAGDAGMGDVIGFFDGIVRLVAIGIVPFLGARLMLRRAAEAVEA